MFDCVVMSAGRLARKSPLFDAAKHGDEDAAYRLVLSLCAGHPGPKRLASYGKPILVPVISASSRNRLPIAMCRFLAGRSGVEIDDGFRLHSERSRKEQKAVERLLNRGAFSGDVREGRKYVLVDDFITMGGTVNELRLHIEAGGGVPVAGFFMGSSLYSVPLLQTEKMSALIRERFDPAELSAALAHVGLYGGDVSKLTNSECRYILKFRTLDEFRHVLFTAWGARRKRNVTS
ncbi:MAG: hypothetical protein MJ061_05940 [Mailhella sp.]|nr:hypothetical protein [Mailhella sp.]